MGRCTTEHDVDNVVRQAKTLWLGIRRRFSDPRLRDLQDDLESAAIERVLRDRDTFAHLQGGERDAAIQRTLTSGALDEARLTIGSPNHHHRKLLEIVGADPDNYAASRDDEDPTLAAAELLEALNLTGEEHVIAGCYALGCRNARDIARVTGKSTSYVRERLRTLLPYMRGMLADHVAPELDESTRQLICRYAQGELHTRRRWRERHNAERLVANSPTCMGLWHAQCAADERLRILLPAPILAALTTARAGGVAEPAAHAAERVRQHVAEATATARRHAAGLYHKAIDPTPLAGMRPGAAGAVLASCLTIGGGATYCVNAAVNPLDAIHGTVSPAEHKPTRAAAHKKSSATRALDTAVVTPTITPPAGPAPVKQPASAAPAASHPAAASPPASTPGEEFSPEAPSSSTTSSRQASSTRSQPAPAPANGPGEFGP